MMNLFPAQGVSQEVKIEKTLLNDLVRTTEKLQADNIDLEKIDNNQKLIIESQGIRIVNLETTIEIMEDQIGKIKVAYQDIAKTNKKKKFWVWLKGVATGTVVGSVITIILIL